MIVAPRRLIANMTTNKLSERYCKSVVDRVMKNAATKHKGDFGRVGILGGSKDYAGAPYFAAAAALRSGADLVHVFCATEAASVIKQYSPDLIVHGLLTDKPNLERESGLYQEIEQWLPRLHTLLIGPGLGRSEYTLRIARRVLQTFVTRAGENGRMKRNVVLDADGLCLASQNLDWIREISSNSNVRVWLTPNAAEFARLCDAADKQLTNQNNQSLFTSDGNVDEKRLVTLATRLNVILIRKGPEDLIANGRHGDASDSGLCETLVTCNVTGSVRRCGGQGDLLSGCLATLATWLSLAETESESETGTGKQQSRQSLETLCCATAYTACSIVRRSNQLAHDEMHFSMITSDMLRQFPVAVSQTLLI